MARVCCRLDGFCMILQVHTISLWSSMGCLASGVTAGRELKKLGSQSFIHCTSFTCVFSNFTHCKQVICGFSKASH